ncbi:MAG: Ig-like domain-containing protein, partial [Natronospirillum sp.]
NAVEVELNTQFQTSVSAFSDLVVKTTPPNATNVDLVIDPIAGDDVVNQTESGGDVAVSGSATGDVQTNDEVHIYVDGGAFYTTVQGDNSFSMNVPATSLYSAEGQNFLSVSVFATDEAGNEGEISTTHEFTVDTAAPTVTVDEVITNQASPILAGNVSEEGTVEVTVNGESYSATVDAYLYWTLDLAAQQVVLEDGEYVVEAIATSLVGNVSEPSTGNLDLKATPPNLTVEDAFSYTGTPIIYGTTDDDATLSDLDIRVTIGPNYAFNAEILAGGDWEFDANESQQQQWNPLLTDEYVIFAEAEDHYGNITSASATLLVDLDYADPVANADLYGVLVDTVFAGDVTENDVLSQFATASVETVTTPANGSLILNADGTFSYSPDSGFSGEDSFTYELRDDLVEGVYGTALVEFIVGAPPVANDS